MISVNLDFIGLGADKVGKAMTHVASRSFGKGKTKNIIRRSVGLFEDIGDADRKKLSFAGAWACDN